LVIETPGGANLRELEYLYPFLASNRLWCHTLQTKAERWNMCGVQRQSIMRIFDIAVFTEPFIAVVALAVDLFDWQPRGLSSSSVSAAYSQWLIIASTRPGTDILSPNIFCRSACTRAKRCTYSGEMLMVFIYFKVGHY
jgi:hypothetical protein